MQETLKKDNRFVRGEFLSLKPTISQDKKMISETSMKRAQKWLETYKKLGLMKDWSIKKQGSIDFVFDGGLRVCDFGDQIVFAAVNARDSVDMNLAIRVVESTAHHLRQNDWLGFELDRISDGGLTFLSAFCNSWEQFENEHLLNKHLKDKKIKGY